MKLCNWASKIHSPGLESLQWSHSKSCNFLWMQVYHIFQGNKEFRLVSCYKQHPAKTSQIRLINSRNCHNKWCNYLRPFFTPFLTIPDTFFHHPFITRQVSETFPMIIFYNCTHLTIFLYLATSIYAIPRPPNPLSVFINHFRINGLSHTSLAKFSCSCGSEYTSCSPGGMVASAAANTLLAPDLLLYRWHI